MDDIAQHPSRVLIRVPLRTGVSFEQLGLQLEALLDGLRGRGFRQILVALPEGTPDASWNLAEGPAPAHILQGWIERWSSRPAAGERAAALAGALAGKLAEPALAGVSGLAILLPFLPVRSAWRPIPGTPFSAVVELGAGAVPTGGSSPFFTFPQQAPALFSRLEAPPPASASRDKGPGLPPPEPLPRNREIEDEVRSVGPEPPEPAPPLSRRKARTGAESEVYLGISAPDQVAPGEAFVARFAAYTAAFRREVRRIFASEAPAAGQRLDLERCRWKIGTRVTVRLAAEGATVEPAVQHFSWDGRRQILRFDLEVDHRREARQLVLRCDVFIAGVRILALRPEVALAAGATAKAPRELEVPAPKSAFASYARADEAEVLGRVRSVAIQTGMEVFTDRFGILPGRPWQEVLAAEIASRDLFWLFWSRHAMESEYVEWEWRTALAQKTLSRIVPHPLEPANLAPPPAELASIQFGGAYEAYLASLG